MHGVAVLSTGCGYTNLVFLMSLHTRPPSTMALACLEASARLRSFTAAAQELSLTQGAVSRQVQTLEQRLGVELFTRRRNALALTEAGRYYLGEVGPLLQQLERATVNVMALKGRGGDLSLSVGASIGSYWLIPRLPNFTRDHSEITLNLGTRVQPVNFGAEQFDASLEFSDGKRPDLHSEFILPLDLSPYAAPGWIVRHGDAVNVDTPRAALIQHQGMPDAWNEWFAREGIAGEAGREGPRYDVMSMALNAALAGMGTALLPPYMTRDLVASGQLRQLSCHSWRYSKGYFLVYPPASAQMQSLQVFRKWLLAQVDPAP
jgi:LysR family glycine cleavage system transcriptional activator